MFHFVYFLVNTSKRIGEPSMNLELQNITKKRRKRVIVDQISYSFPQNGLVLLTGENGSGKTTMLNIIAGKDNEYEGDLFCDGTKIDLKNCNYYAESEVSYITQDSLIFDDLSVVDNLLLPFSDKDFKKAIAILEKLGLENSLRQKASVLSGGEKQRLAFSRIMYEPKEMILIDEITAHLDDESAEILVKEILELSKNHTVLFVTHDPRLIQLSDIELLRIEDQKLQVLKKKEVVEQTKPVIHEKTKTYPKSDLLSAFHLEKKSHILFSMIVCFFTLFTVLFGNIAFSFQTTQVEENGQPKIHQKYYEKTNEVFSLTSDYLPFFKMDDSLEGEPYLLTDTDTQKIGKDDGDMSGGNYISFIEYQDNSSLKLVQGRKPVDEKECIVSDLCFSNLGLESLESSYHFFTGDYKIVGVYEAKDSSDLNRRFLNKEKFSGLSRICYGFQIESAFVIDSSRSSRTCLYPNSSENRKAYLSQPFMLSFDDVDVINVDAQGNNVLKFYSYYVSLSMLEYVAYIGLGLFLLLFVISFYMRNKRKYLLLRFLGYSRHRLTFSNLLAFGLNALVTTTVSLGIALLGNVILNSIYSGLLQCSCSLFEIDLFAVALPFISSAVFILVFGIILYHVLSKNDISEELSEVKRK
jgi:ABC-type lipoprotein export system ATPase subunit